MRIGYATFSGCFAVVICLLTGLRAAAAADTPAPLNIGSRRELLLDRYLIDALRDAEFVLGEPRDEGIVLRFDRPWEGQFCAYVTVIRDGDLLRLYYRGHPEDSRDGGADEVTCYAESCDGRNWIRPNLGLFTVQGTKDNNVVLADAAPVTHNFSPFLDTNPQATAQQRFKAVGGYSKTGLMAYASADGTRWSKLTDEPVFRDEGWAFDSQNVAFWSEAENRYLLYYRRASNRIRAVARSTSSDFLHWTAPVQMTYSDTQSGTPSHHLYTNQTHPYFRAPHIYIATAARFMPGRQVVTDEQAAALKVHPEYFKDTSDAVLLTSRGGDRYDRTFSGSFIRPGIGLQNWVSRTNYPALNVVQTGPTEMSLYVNQDYGQPTAHLHRYSLRLDGFASLRAPYAGGEFVTKPLIFAGQRLLLNYSTSAAGGIRVELQDASGQPVPGYALDDSVELIGNEIEREATWKSGANDLGQLAGKPVRLRFVMQDADLFALRFSVD